MKPVVALLLLVVAVNAQRPKPCVSPPAWSGRIFQADPSKKEALVGRLHYDERGERLAMAEEVGVDGKKTFYDYIVLYREKKLYRIEMSANETVECTVSSISESFKPVQIPSNATFALKAVQGSNAAPELGVEVNVFYGEMAQGKYAATVTAIGCLPIGSEFFGGKDIGTVHTWFFDIELGFDPERFVPPEECKGRTKEVPHHPDRVRFRQY